jgi:intraflagellar transport protein 88
VSLEANGMVQEALTKYTEIIKSKQFQHAGRLRVNMGNIHFQQKKYLNAIKMYRMALDIIPQTSKEMRYKILRNIGHAFVRQGKYQEAINSYENIMKGSPDHKTAFNLLICLYASGDKLRMKDCFSSMLINENEEEDAPDEDEESKNTNDKLKDELKERRREELRLIILSSKLIAPVIENDIIESYDWILEKLKSSSYPEAES